MKKILSLISFFIILGSTAQEIPGVTRYLTNGRSGLEDLVIDTNYIHKLISYRDVSYYGAEANNIKDDQPAIQSAINTGSGYIVIGKSLADTFKISKPIYITQDNYVIEINGVIKLQDGYTVNLASNADSANNFVIISSSDISKFEVGQWISISDTNMAIQGGGTGQIRRLAVTYPIKQIIASNAADNDTLIFDDNIAFNFTTAALAKIGHTQSCIIIENASNITISGTGIIDQNKANQYDVEPIRYVAGISKGEELRASCAIFAGVPPLSTSFTHEKGLKITGITLQNSILHNLAIRGIDSVIVNSVKFISAHDKALLSIYVNSATIENCIFKNSDFEDGITLYAGNYNFRIINNYFEDIARVAIVINPISGNIYINGAKIVNSAQAILIASDSVYASNIHITGGGSERYTAGSKYLIDIGNVDSCYLSNIIIDNSTLALGGILIDGTSNNIHVNSGKISNLTKTSYGNAITIAGNSGNYPENIFIRNLHISNNLKGINAESGVNNINVTNCHFSNNSTNTTNLPAINYNGSTGLINSPTTDYEGLMTFENLKLSLTTSATTGIIFKNTDSFIHDFRHATGSTAQPTGANTFVGVKAGNFTMGSTATNVNQASYNTGIGYRTLEALTTGSYNTAIGYMALYKNPTANNNVAIGYRAGFNNEATGNTYIGANAGYTTTTGSYNIAISSSALYFNSTGSNNVAVGRDAAFNSTGSNGIYLGYRAGYNETGNQKMYFATDSTSWINGMSSTSKLLIYADQSDADKANHFMNVFSKVAIGEVKALSAYQLEIAGSVNVTTSLKIGTLLKLTPGSAPATPEEGDIYMNGTDHHLYLYNGTSWVQLDN